VGVLGRFFFWRCRAWWFLSVGQVSPFVGCDFMNAEVITLYTI